MTIIAELKDHWAITGNTNTARAIYRSWVTRHTDLGFYSSPHQLTEAIYTAPPTLANQLVGILLTETVAGDRLARETCFQALRPLVGATLKRISHANNAITDDVVSELLTEALDIIDTLAHQYRPDMQWPITTFASRLFNRARRARTRRHIYDNTIDHHDIDLTETAPVAPTRSDPGTELILFLAAAVKHETITHDEARLVASRAMLDEAVGRNTVHTIGIRAAQKRHHRVITRLHDAAHDIADTIIDTKVA